MTKLSCYVYEEGRDFILPESFAGLLAGKDELAECFVRASGNGREPDPEHFCRVGPEDAEVFLFPHPIGVLTDFLGTGPVAAFIRSLPHMAGRERRHVFSDQGDAVERLPLPVCLMRRSLIKERDDRVLARGKALIVGKAESSPSPRCLVTWYLLPEHVAEDAPSFHPGDIRYDCSFVGAYSHVFRRAASLSLARHPGIRFFNGGFEGSVVEGNFFFNRNQTPEEAAARRAAFRKATRASLTVLCPPGVGPQSVRMYETMYYGRVPVLFTRKIYYPLEHIVDYDSFCLFIGENDVNATGERLRDFLDTHTTEQARAMGVLACKTWNAWFGNGGRSALMASMLRDYLAEI